MKHLKIKVKKLPVKILAICVALAMLTNSFAGIEDDMTSMFNSMGVEANYTKGGAFHGQAGSLYTGGSLSVRAPVSSMQLANIQLPTINAGCGGIDFFAGAFSFVNKEQFIQFTRNLGNNAAGVAFDLALKALDPMIQDAIGGIRDMANRINQANLNSCETGKLLAGGLMGTLGSTINQQCRASAVSTGAADDGADANWVCNFGNNLVKEVNKAKNSGSPQDTIGFTGGNLAYLALTKAYGSISDSEMDLMLSLTGTAVFIPLKQIEGEKDKLTTDIRVWIPTILNAEQFLYGKHKNELNSKTITVDLLQCRDGSSKQRENCTVQKDAAISSLRYQVKDRLGKMADKIRTNASWSETEKQDIAKIVNNTELPVLRMGVSDAFLGTNMLQKNAVLDAITVDYAGHIIEKYETTIRSSIGFFNKTDEASDTKKEELLANLKDLRRSIFDAKQAALQRLQVEQSFMNALAMFDNQWRAQFVGMSNSMTFDQVNRL